MIEATEKVRLIEKKVETELIRDIISGYSKIDFELPPSFFKRIDEIYYGNSNKHLSFEDRDALQNLCHVYWYYSFSGYSYITFLVIVPYTALLFLTVGTAGVLGSLARMVIDHVRDIISIDESKCFAFPISGFFMGIMVLAISYIIPSVFIRGDTTVNTTSVVLICFFAGLFMDLFYNWIMNVVGRFLKSKEKP